MNISKSNFDLNFFLFKYFFSVSFKFGAITMLSGILGVPLGALLSTKLVKHYKRVDPIICGVGLLLSAPFMTLTLYTVQFNSTLTYICIFFGELALNLNWAIVADILLVRIYKFYSHTQKKIKQTNRNGNIREKKNLMVLGFYLLSFFS